MRKMGFTYSALIIFLLSSLSCSRSSAPTDVLRSYPEVTYKQHNDHLVAVNNSDEFFTGIRVLKYRNFPDSIHSTEYYENGLRLRAQGTNWSYEYRYDDKGKLVGLTEYFGNGLEKESWLYGGHDDDGLGYMKQWYPSGQLKFKMGWDEDNKYHGTMTKWDELGNIIEQEKYVHGELIEA